MSEQQTTQQPTEPQAAPQPERRPPGWLQRKCVRQLLREATEPHDGWTEYDKRDNDQSRLPASEEVHLGGFVLAEAFTPSTISALYEALERLPTKRAQDKREWIAELTKSRSAERLSGWRNIGTVRRPGSVGFDGFSDASLPDGVEAVWLYLGFATPSVAVVGATFTLAEEAGDLSQLLRADYYSQVGNPHLQVSGTLGSLRAKIPWARPKEQFVSYTWETAESKKREAVQAFFDDHENACWEWLTRRFPGGKFGAEEYRNRPYIRILLTKEYIPFTTLANHGTWMGAVRLGFAPTVFRCVDRPGWSLSLDDWPRDQRRYSAVAAARRADVAKERTPGEIGDENWDLMYWFHQDHFSLVMPWIVSCLQSLYVHRIGALRDRAGGWRRLRRRPVSQARDLDQYLLGDGLDAVTIATDVEASTRKLAWFRHGVVEYTEDLSVFPTEYRAERKPAELVPNLRRSLRWQAKRILTDAPTTTENIRASAELRQAITNTQLQRILLGLAVLALILAVISIVISANPG